MLICLVFFTGTYPPEPKIGEAYYEVVGIAAATTTKDSEDEIRVIADGKQIAICDRETKKWIVEGIGTFDYYRTVVR